jgi:formylglycine-generating enzyme required for sulfatase activity
MLPNLYLGFLLLSSCTDPESSDAKPGTGPIQGDTAEDQPSDTSVDADQDGVPAEEDCDDGDPLLGSIQDDSDCDGALVGDDCDDSDAGLGALESDADCDGALVGDDCDDQDPLSTLVSEDADCDGALSSDDCDDGDPGLGSGLDDSDCDGIPAVDDCDDSDPSVSSDEGDADCDGTPEGEDCDDSDPSLGSLDLDGDGLTSCDGDRCDDNADAQGLQDCIGLEFILVDTSDGDPLGRYTLSSGFHVMSTELTQEMFAALNGYSATWPPADGEGARYPAYNITWNQLAATANALSALEGLDSCYSCTGSFSGTLCTDAPAYSGTGIYGCPGYRMPTEAEWELAARSGTTSGFWTGEGDALGGDFSFDQCSPDVTIQDGVWTPPLGDYAWFCGNASSAMEVGQKLPNGYGLYDIHGNVSEWCHDYYLWDGWPVQSEDPVNMVPADRMIRGGNWINGPVFLPVSMRASHYQEGYYTTIGGRLVRTAL